MEQQEKSFGDALKDARLKELKRRLKLDNIKRQNGSQQPFSPHNSISDLSSIRGDIPLSDLSFCTPSVTSSRAGSDVVASSINLKKKLSKHLKTGQRTGPTTSSVFDESLDNLRIDKDRVMMPPPQAISSSHKPQSSVNTESKGQHNNSVTNFPLPQNYDNRTNNIHRSDCNAAVDNEAPKEISKKNDSSRQCARMFRNWIVRLNDRGQITIKGKLESGEQARSKAVKGRLNATTVVSVLNHKYLLVGDIHDVREELPEYVRGKFYNGFPTDWENVRQLWQGYVASGCSLQFRWPRPVADSDDDLRSDITDLTVAHPKNTRTRSTSTVSTNRPCQPVKEMDRSSRKKESHSDRRKGSKDSKDSKDSDISSDYSAATEHSDTKAQASTFETSCGNTGEKTCTAPVSGISCGNTADRISTGQYDHGTKNNKEPTSENVHTDDKKRSKCGEIFSGRKVDVIVNNMIGKNCSMEYIDKFIRAVDCLNKAVHSFNELLAMPSTNSIETMADEGASPNHKSDLKTDTMSAETHSQTAKGGASKNIDISKLQHRRQTALPRSNSDSLESSEESIEESPPKYNNTYVCKQSTTSRTTRTTARTSMGLQQYRNSALQSKNVPNYFDVVNRDQNGSTLVGLTTKSDSRHPKNREKQVSSTLPREEVVEKLAPKEQRKRKTIFDSEDSDTEASVSNRARNVSINNLSIGTRNSQRALGQKPQPIGIERKNKRIAEGGFGTNCDSDVSIIDTSIMPTIKPRMVAIEKRADNPISNNYEIGALRADFSFTNNQSDEHSRANSLVPKRIGNPSNEEVPGSNSGQLVDQCTVQLIKVKTDMHNRSRSNCTPSKSEKSTPRRLRSKIDTDHRVDELAASDSENVGMRMSSRGRRILPPLDYWNGERVTLKGRELIYSPGVCHSASLSGNSSVLKENATTVSLPASLPAGAENSNKSTTGPTDCSKSGMKSRNKNSQREEAYIPEIPANNDENSDHVTSSNKRLTRGAVNNRQGDLKRNMKSRSVYENPGYSSEEVEYPVRAADWTANKEKKTKDTLTNVIPRVLSNTRMDMPNNQNRAGNTWNQLALILTTRQAEFVAIITVILLLAILMKTTLGSYTRKWK